MENTAGAQDTLQSIVRLVAQIGDMPVGEDVKGDVEDALSALDKVRTPEARRASLFDFSS